ANPTVMMTIKPLPAATAPGEARGQKLITVPDDRWQRCWIKSIALLPNILAKHAADRAGADEAIFVDGNIVQEGASSNVFIIRDGQLITSPIGAKVLPGVTREAILEIAESVGLLVVERGIELAELLTPGEAFISSTTRELAWISMINDKQIAGECGPNTRALHTAFQRLTCDRRP
ncbi:MAG: aminotransferase class IV, partial [Burkholderiales bacterium]|nr:aminotransferase class IV [Phycisphaerae bacterium]